MKVPVYDKVTGATMVKRENAEPYPFCECCGNEEPYMYICDHLILCRDCAKNWKRLGVRRFLERYWLPFDFEKMEQRCIVKED